jgi:hypothetical protein
MLTSDRETLCHFLVSRQPYGDAAPVVTIVGLGYNRETHSPRRAYRLALRLHQLLSGYG